MNQLTGTLSSRVRRFASARIEQVDPRVATTHGQPTGSLTRWRRWAMLGMMVVLMLVFADGADRRPSPPTSGKRLAGPALPPLEQPVLRIASFNIHSGVGRDGRYDLARVADSVRGDQLIALFEVRDSLGLPGGNQAAQLARRLGLGWLYAPSEQQWWHGHFGNAILSSVAVSNWQSAPLDGTRGKAFRNYVLVDIPWRGSLLHLLAAHLDREDDRSPQLATVVQRFLSLDEPAILMGDLNSTADDLLIQALRENAAIDEPVGRLGHDDPPGRIDWIFTRGLNVVAAGIVDSGASDHGCLWAEVTLPNRN